MQRAQADVAQVSDRRGDDLQCIFHVSDCSPMTSRVCSHSVGGSRCVTEIPNAPDDAQWWIMLVAKDREDCRHIEGAVAFDTPAACC